MDDALERVRRALAALGSETDVMVMAERTHTAAEAAAAAHCQLGQIVKSLVIFVSRKPMLALVSGDRRLSERLLADRHGVGKKQVRMANAEEVLTLTGYPIGGVSPFGLPQTLPVLIDEALSRFDTVWTAAGTPNAIFPILLQDLIAFTSGDVAAIAT